MKQVFTKNQGSTLISVMLAAVVIGAGILGLISSTQVVFKTSLRNRMIARQITVESKVLDALNNPRNFDPANTANNFPAGVATMKLFDTSLPPNLMAQVGTPTCFKDNLKPCACGASDCLLKVEVAIKEIPNGSRIWKGAYRVSYTSKESELSTNVLGVPAAAGNPPWLDTTNHNGIPLNNYNAYINTDYFRGRQKQEGKSCGQNQFAYGFDAETGDLKCATSNLILCPPNTLGQNIEYDSNTNSFKLTCSPPTPTATCGQPNYSINTLNDITGIEPMGPRPSGTCVFVGADSISWSSGANATPPQQTLSAPNINNWVVCPVHYRVGNVNCSVTNNSYVCQRCSYVVMVDYCCEWADPKEPWRCTKNCQRPETRWKGGEQASASCPTQTTGQYTVSGQLNPGGSIGCPCGDGQSVFQGYAQMSGTCNLIETRTINF